MYLGRHAAGCADINRTRVSGEAVDAAPGLRPGSREAPDRVPQQRAFRDGRAGASSVEPRMIVRVATE